MRTPCPTRLVCYIKDVICGDCLWVELAPGVTVSELFVVEGSATFGS